MRVLDEPAVVPRGDVRAVGDEQPHHVVLAVVSGRMERRPPAVQTRKRKPPALATRACMRVRVRVRLFEYVFVFRGGCRCVCARCGASNDNDWAARMLVSTYKRACV